MYRPCQKMEIPFSHGRKGVFFKKIPILLQDETLLQKKKKREKDKAVFSQAWLSRTKPCFRRTGWREAFQAGRWEAGGTEPFCKVAKWKLSHGNLLFSKGRTGVCLLCWGRRWLQPPGQGWTTCL